MSAAAASISVPNAAATRPVVNPWMVAVVVIATFMELLDTAIANVVLPHIAGLAIQVGWSRRRTLRTV